MTDEVINVSIPFVPNLPQRSFLSEMKRFNIFECHRGAGKTYLSCMLLIASCMGTKYSDARFAFLAPEAKQGERNFGNIIMSILKPLGDLVKYQQSKGIITFPNNSKIYLLGVKNKEALRGIRWDGVVLDEFGTMDGAKEFWDEVLLPSLERWDTPDRTGWVLITTTPPHSKHFYHELYLRADKEKKHWNKQTWTVHESQVYSQEWILRMKSMMTPSSFAIEYECSHNIPSEGAYWGECLTMAEEQGRITKVAHDPTKGVYASFDIGTDGTAIWWAQIDNFGNYNIIDYWEEQQQTRDIMFYANILRSRPYRYNRIWLPHDGDKHFQGATASFYDKLKPLYSAGIVKVLPRENVDMGIFRVIEHFYKCTFDKLACRVGLASLREYVPKIDKNGVVQDKPQHNWASHGADSFRYLINGLVKHTKGSESEDIYPRLRSERETTSIMDFDPY